MSEYKLKEILENMTLAEIIELLSNNNIPKTNSNKLLTTNEVLELYPMFTRYTLNKAINEKSLPFFREGHKMFFEKETIDKWLKEHTSTKKSKYRL